MAINGFVINLNSEKPDELRAFYRDVVGLKPNPEMGEGALLASQTAFLIDGHSDVHGATKEPARAWHNFFVDDLASEQARMESAGVTFIRTAGKEPWGGSISTFIDPDGNYGQLIQFDVVKGGMYSMALNTDDVPRLQSFYVDLIGLVPNPDMGAVMAASTPLHIADHSDVHGATKEPARVLPNFFVDDLAAEQTRLEGAGVKFIRTAGKEPWGGVISTFLDPDGNYGQIIEFKQ
jgi:predicted enzyme related to lactoylglutathione lyase